MNPNEAKGREGKRAIRFGRESDEPIWRQTIPHVSGLTRMWLSTVLNLTFGKLWAESSFWAL